MTPGGPAALEVSELSVRYPDGTQGLSGLSFTVGRGEAVALLGANGSGKSTLLLSIMGVLRFTGRIAVLGTEVGPKTLREVRKKTGVLFQDVDAQLFSPRVLDDVCFGPLNLGLSSEAALAVGRRCLAAVGLTGYEERTPHHLSFGEKKRVAIASALALEPELLVLDEPTAGLDPRTASELMDLLDDLRRAGKTILATTHDLHLAEALCDRVLVLGRGRLVAEGRPELVLRDSAFLEANNLVHRHRHRHRGPAPGSPEAPGHAHAHGHGHEHPHGGEPSPGEPAPGAVPHPAPLPAEPGRRLPLVGSGGPE